MKQTPEMNLHIFAPMEARDEIPTATPTLSWSVIEMHLLMKPPQCNWKSEMQDDDHQTKSTYISACRYDGNEIPTAKPMF